MRLIQIRDTESLDLALTASNEFAHAVGLSVPVMALMLVASVAAQVAAAGGLALRNGYRIAPWTRISRLGLGTSAATLGLQWLSVSVLLAYGWHWSRNHTVDLAACVGRTNVARQTVGTLALHFAWIACAVWVISGGLELALSRRAWLQRHTMTRAEKQREQRESEGDRWIAALRTERHQESLSQPALAALRQASLVVHASFETAILLRYESGQEVAPRILAVSVGAMARRVLSEALGAGVPVAQDDSLAPVLAHGRQGSLIPESTYERVAELFGRAGRLVDTRSLDA
jgi:flagellar biosynthesis protein FlhB